MQRKQAEDGGGRLLLRQPLLCRVVYREHDCRIGDHGPGRVRKLLFGPSRAAGVLALEHVDLRRASADVAKRQDVDRRQKQV